MAPTILFIENKTVEKIDIHANIWISLSKVLKENKSFLSRGESSLGRVIG